MSRAVLDRKGGSPARSQRSASFDDRSAAHPFSVNESDLIGLGNDCDSAQASIASWVDIFDQSRLGAGTGIRTTAVRAEFDGIESDLSGVEQAQFKLPAMDDESVDDHLNQAFINEHSMCLPGASAAKETEFFEVKAKLANLEVHNFSITSLLEKNNSMPGRRTHQVEKPYFAAPKQTEEEPRAEDPKD